MNSSIAADVVAAGMISRAVDRISVRQGFFSTGNVRCVTTLRDGAWLRLSREARKLRDCLTKWSLPRVITIPEPTRLCGAPAGGET